MKDNWSARQNDKATAVAPPGRGVSIPTSLGSGRTRLSVRLAVWGGITCLIIGAAGAAIIQLDTTDVTIAAPVSGAPRIAMKHDGTGFVIVWQAADGGTAGPAGNVGIFAQTFNGNWQATGAAFRVNATVNNSQVHPAVGIDASGNFVVAWEAF